MYKGQYLICRTHLTANDLFWVWRVKHNTGVNHPDFLPAEIKLRTWSLTSSSLFSFSGFLSLMSVGSELSSSRSRLYSVDLTGELSHLRRLLGNQMKQSEFKAKTCIPSMRGKTRKNQFTISFGFAPDWLKITRLLWLVTAWRTNYLKEKSRQPWKEREKSRETRSVIVSVLVQQWLGSNNDRNFVGNLME